MTGMPGSEEAVEIVVVEEARHQVRARVQPRQRGDPVAELGRRPAAREHLRQRAVQREVQHARQHRAAVGPGHVRLDLARLQVLERPVDAETLAEDQEVAAPGAARDLGDAGRPRVAGMQEVEEVLRRHVERGVDPERVDADLADPVRIAGAQRAPHDRVPGVQVVQPGHLEVQLLPAVGVVGDGRGPVVDARAALPRVARVVQVERMLAGPRLRPRAGVGLPEPGRVGRVPAADVVEEVAGVVDDDVLHQVHAAPVQRVGQAPVVLQRAQVRVDAGEVGGPVAVITAVATRGVEPLVEHRRRDPQRRRAQALDVVEPVDQALQVAAAEAVAAPRVVLAGALVVVARVAVGEAVGHDEVDDLVAPVGAGDVQLQAARRRPLQRLLRPCRGTGPGRHPGRDGQCRRQSRGCAGQQRRERAVHRRRPHAGHRRAAP